MIYEEFKFTIAVEVMFLLLVVPINEGKMIIVDTKDKLVTTIEATTYLVHSLEGTIRT